MAESTLSTQFSDFRSLVGHYLGYQRDSTAWTTDQADDINAVLKSGQRLVYNCGYDWSWLKPVATLTLASAEVTVRLPDDFAAVDGNLQVSDGAGTYFRAMAAGPLAPIYQAAAREPDRTGQPLFACVEPVKGTSLHAGQRWQLRFFPTADADYTVVLAYRVNVDAIAVDSPFPYGGAQHAELFLQACKAVAERDIDDIPPGTPQAVHQNSFDRMLEQAKQLDRRTKPHTVGRNRDTGFYRRGGLNYAARPLLPILIDGVHYD